MASCVTIYVAGFTKIRTGVQVVLMFRLINFEAVMLVLLMGGSVKYSVELESDATICMPSFIKIG
jgi:hypothetical protein